MKYRILKKIPSSIQECLGEEDYLQRRKKLGWCLVELFKLLQTETTEVIVSEDIEIRVWNYKAETSAATLTEPLSYPLRVTL